MSFLKQSTAASCIVGPILDSTGVEYASAVIGDLSISKNGGTLTAMASTATLTYIANGQYTLAMNTGNTDTLGRVEISCNKATYQMPQKCFVVMPANIFDSLVSGSDVLDVSVIQWLGTAASTPTVAGVPNVNVKTWNDLTTVALPLVPTIAGRTLDVAATGEAGLDFNNVLSTGTVTLNGLTITNNLLVSGNSTVTGTTTRTGAVSFGSTFGVSGATTLAGLTTGALSCTTITASGAVAFQSTFAVTTSTSLAALSCSTLTASGAVAFQSTLGVAGTTTLAALTTTGAMTVNSFTCTNVFTVSGATTLTGAVAATNASNNIVGVSLLTGSFVTATFGTCDLTATMKTSVTTAATAATPIAASVTGAVGSVTGNVGGNVVGSVGSVTGNVGGNVAGSVGSLATQAKADVNAEVVDCLNVDTYAEPSSVPAATATLRAKIGWIFALLRNKRTQTSATETLYADDGSTSVSTSSKADDGTTLTRGEWS